MRGNFKTSCLGYLVAMVTKEFLKIGQRFTFLSIAVTIATTIISITLDLEHWIVIRHLCFRNEYQMYAYYMVFHENILLYVMTMKCHLQAKIVSSLAEPT